MKEFLIFVLLFATCSHGDAKKVCILFEQETVTIASIVSHEESVTVKEEKLDVQEDIVITLGEILEVTDEISVASVDAVTEDTITEEVLTEKTPDVVTEAISVASNAAYSKPTNICALEGITLFDDQNVSNSLNTLNSSNQSHLDESVIFYCKCVRLRFIFQFQNLMLPVRKNWPEKYKTLLQLLYIF